MTDEFDDLPGADDLEQLWAGEFGDSYVDRNTQPVTNRRAFWSSMIDTFPAQRVLEVGCAHGENIRHLAAHVQPHDLWGLDVNARALRALKESVPDANAVWGSARNLPFRDRWFELVFTVGLLIHQPDATLPIVMSEIVRTTNRWVMCGEYHADETTDIGYRGKPGILFKRDYRRLYEELFPELTVRQVLELNTEEHGFDRVTFIVLERSA